MPESHRVKVAQFCEHTTALSISKCWERSRVDNTQIQVGRPERELSRIICLRRFTNWVKAVQIDKAAHHWGKGRKGTVLDIGCGKGGDLKKWRSVGTHRYIGIGECKLRLMGHPW